MSLDSRLESTACDSCSDVDIFVTNPILTRTQVVSFLCIDLVAFAQESTASQHQIKTVLVQHLRAALVPISVSEYRLRDTGGGAYVAFWSNPEFALYTALALWQACGTENASTALPSQRLRVGLHIGTVKETTDVEGRINYVGDGINAAKRIQNLAEPGQMLSSRSFFDAFDHLDPDYSRLFTQCGSGDDKNGRSYELFSLSFGEAALAKLSQEIARNASISLGASSSEPQKTEHPLSQVSDFIKTWFMPVNAVLAFVTFYIAIFGKLAKPASVMHYTGLLLFLLAIFMGLTSWWFKSAKGTSLSARHPKWAAFLHHKPIAWLSLGLGLILLAAAYFVKEQDVPPKDDLPTQSPAKVAPEPQFSNSEPLTDTVKPAAELSTSKRAPVGSQTKPETHSSGKTFPLPVVRSPETISANAGKLPDKSSTTNPRCTSLLQKAGTGEPLSPQEQKEMVSTCQ